MKKFILFLLLAVMSLSISATEIVSNYRFDNIKLSKSSVFDIIGFEETMQTNRAGEPMLPYRQISLLLPPGEIATSIEVIREGKTLVPGTFNLMPAQNSKPLSEKKRLTFQKNEKVYNSSEPYPASPNGELSTQFLNGFGFAFSSITPVEYIPSEGKLFYYSKITVIVHTAPSEKSQIALSMLKTSAEVLSTVERLAQNDEMLHLYPEIKRSAGDYELLIITPQSFVNGFDPLVAMYLAKGDRSQVVTTEFINANSIGADLQAKIRNFIIQNYQEHQIETVILGGDVEYVPYRGFYCYVQSGSGYTDNGIPADLYYAGLDGNWNTDGDAKWGEPGEDDLLPEIGIGRLPFSNAAEQANLINKSVKYQTQPVLGEFSKPLLAGEHLYDSPLTYGSDYLELLVGNRSDNGYTTNGIPPLYTIQKMYDEVANWSASDLRNAINQGKQFVHHVGHASQTYVAKMSNSDITNANFAQTNGVIRNYSIFHTHGCDCGSYDYNDCILERMVNIENFAAAVIGNSRYGWFNEGQTEGPAAHLHREMTDAIFTEKISALGPALKESKIMTSPWVTAPGQWEEGALRWNFYDLNILGDPAMHVWSAEPMQTQVNYSAELVLGSTSTSATVSVNGFALPNAVCSILFEGELISRALTDNNGVAELVFDIPLTEIGTAQLIVSGNNCLTQSLPITFIPASGPYVVYCHHLLTDLTGGNGNNLPDYNETVQLQVAMRNVGLELASDLSISMSTDSPWVTFLDNNFNITQLPAGDTVTVENAIGMTILHGIPNQQMVLFNVVTTNGTTSWNSSFSINVLAPELFIGNYEIIDATGNNNGLLDAGETAQLIIQLSNNGSSDAGIVSAVLNNLSSWITVDNQSIELNSLAAGQLTELIYTLHVDPATPTGTVAGLHLDVLDGDYSVSTDLLFSVGLRIEDFESGDFDNYEWHHSGSANWTISMTNPYEGNYASRSGMISDSQQSDLWLSLIVMGNDNIKFARKVSSEAGYDYLSFYIDDSEIDKWAGEIGWEEVSYPINEGSHLLKWSYKKDITVASGSDCAWVDKITFPGTTTIIDLKEKLSGVNFSIWPNPTRGHFVIVTDSENPVKLKIFNSFGKVVLEHYNILNNTSLDASMLSAGIYIVEISNGEKHYRNKMIIQ
ncbi:MAG: hypothetical protein FD155_2456 [Bacteroidetes bacterium]|nr:MAG: hypothetical protein FD155_2456 [Bacteroidota bacterium]